MKDLSGAVKKAPKKYQLLKEWLVSIKNHLWYCFANCEEDLTILREKIMSILEHITGNHDFTNSANFTKVKKCDHTLRHDDMTKYMVKGSPPWLKLKQALEVPERQRDLHGMTHFTHTGHLEAFHSLLNKYFDKRRFYNLQSANCRTQQAILSHNENTRRELKYKEDGTPVIHSVHRRNKATYDARLAKAEPTNIWRNAVSIHIFFNIFISCHNL